jgi:NADH dehydrogenase [ubiquinone] 1 alpha subcomplex assembly factor 7
MAGASFAEDLKASIARRGPMRLDMFWLSSNLHYYAARDPLGAAGDFTTGPEISQVFGELLGLWSVGIWQAMGAPKRFALAELGPGRGTLMRDLLRAARVRPDFVAAGRVNFVEASPLLRAAQARIVPNAIWHRDFTTLPKTATILLANEFLDALPIRQFVRRGGGWTEIFVDASFQPIELPTEDVPDIEYSPDEGAIVETSSDRRTLALLLAMRFERQRGAALLIDYGYAVPGAGSTLQAVRAHAPADAFSAPGDCDLTSHVDFAALAKSAAIGGATVHGPVPQGAFLAALGIHERTEALARANPERAAQLREATRRLTAATEMGMLFKVLAISHPDLPPPPGFS